MKGPDRKVWLRWTGGPRGDRGARVIWRNDIAAFIRNSERTTRTNYEWSEIGPTRNWKAVR